MCRKSKAKYCSLNKYDFIEDEIKNINPYGPTWGRVFSIEKNLLNYDWIIYLDTDIIITNYEKKIENYIDKNYNIIIGRMPDFNTGELNHISTSSIIIKNENWSFDFLQMWKKQKTFINNPYHAVEEKKHLSTLGVGGLFFEQSAFHFLYDENEEIRKKTKLIDGINDIECNHKIDSFLIHFARSPKEKRIKDFLKKKIKV